MFASVENDSATSTQSGAMKNATNSAARGRTRGESSDFIPSWPGLTRPSRSGGHHAHTIGIAGTSPAMTTVFVVRPSQSHLDLAIESVDQRAALRIELRPVDV